jgi:hypothetical protein
MRKPKRITWMFFSDLNIVVDNFFDEHSFLIFVPFSRTGGRFAFVFCRFKVDIPVPYRISSAPNADPGAHEEILTLHGLKVPALLRKTLHCTNPIESMFSTVRGCEDNLKRYWGELYVSAVVGSCAALLRAGIQAGQGIRRPSRRW